MFFKKQRVEEINYYPINKVIDGLVYSWDSIVFMAKNGNGYKFYSTRAQESWGLPVNYLNHRVDSFPRNIVGTLGFRDGSLIQNAKDGRIYVISNAKRCLLTAPLGDYGFDYSQVVEVSDAEVQFHTEGTDI
jgi:hypothetical protein